MVQNTIKLIPGKLYRVKEEGWVLSFLTNKYRATNIGEIFLLADYEYIFKKKERKIYLFLLDLNGIFCRLHLTDESIRLLPEFVERIK